MRIVRLTDVKENVHYVDVDKFFGISTWEGTTRLHFGAEFSITMKESPEELLRILRLEAYIQAPESKPEHGLTDADRAAVEKTRTGPMGAGELKAPSPPKYAME